MTRKLGILLGLAIVAFSKSAIAQEHVVGKVQSTRDCSDLTVHSKLIDLDKELEDDGYKMVFFTSGNMPSKDLMSVRLDCKAGETYQIRYIVGTNAKKYQLNVIDNNIDHIVRINGKVEGQDIHIFKEQFTAKSTGVYVIVYSQQTKLDNCIGLSVFKK